MLGVILVWPEAAAVVDGMVQSAEVARGPAWAVCVGMCPELYIHSQAPLYEIFKKKKVPWIHNSDLITLRSHDTVVAEYVGVKKFYYLLSFCVTARLVLHSV